MNACTVMFNLTKSRNKVRYLCFYSVKNRVMLHFSIQFTRNQINLDARLSSKDLDCTKVNIGPPVIAVNNIVQFQTWI